MRKKILDEHIFISVLKAAVVKPVVFVTFVLFLLLLDSLTAR